MLDRFEVHRDAEKIVQAWGPIDYLYPHLKGNRFKRGDRIGVVVGKRNTASNLVELR